MDKKADFINTPINNLYKLLPICVHFADQRVIADIGYCEYYNSHYLLKYDNIQICVYNYRIYYNVVSEIIVISPNKLIRINLTMFYGTQLQYCKLPGVRIYKLSSEILCNERNFLEMKELDFDNKDLMHITEEFNDLTGKTIHQLLQNNLIKSARKN